ncbi:MAG: signal peptide peptidase SppA [Saprospiraceae bacterium]|nr:signal peptide peptidase SppA [Saprospiraceae bacterium]
MKKFLGSILSSCLGTLLALIVLILVFAGIGSTFMATSKASKHVQANSILRLVIPDELPEQSNNRPLQNFNLDNSISIGLHDLTRAIKNATTDGNIKGIYLQGSGFNHPYASLKVIRDALLEFKNSGKFIVTYAQFIDHKSYYLQSVAQSIYAHPYTFIDLKGFQASVPHFKELFDKLGIDFNIYYAGEFKSATEPFRFNKMSAQNRLQLREFLQSEYQEYLKEIANSRTIDKNELQNLFDLYKCYSPKLALSNKLIDSIAYESDVYANMRSKIGLQESDKMNFISIEDYFETSKSKNEDYSSSNRIAVVYAEGDITDASGEEGQIGRKYIKIFRDIRTTKSIKAMVLRVNSPGGSAMLSDEILKEIDLIRAAGKPVVVSMGNYAASGGYYIACHADSIFANPYTLTGSIGVFALIPNFTKISGDKMGIDIDTVGTGSMACKFNVMLPWGTDEARILQENISETYNRFISVISEGRKLEIEKVQEIAKGRIWSGTKAIEIGLVDALGELKDAILCASRMASIDKYRISEFPTQKDPMQKWIDAIQGKKEDQSEVLTKSILKSEMSELYPYYTEFKYWKSQKGYHMKLPFVFSN